MAKLKVMMMGGRRCGKTSALASLFYESIHGAVNNYLTIADKTVLESKGGEVQDSLNSKTLELMQRLETATSATFLVDNAPTQEIWDYTLRVSIPGTTQSLDIEFRDAPGECFMQGTEPAKKVEEYVKECDIYVVIVDTPYLMGPVDGYCTESINLGTNVVNDIQGFLTGLDNKEGKDAKMVLFVPIKCEYWVKQGRIYEVVKRVKEVYSTAIKNLSEYEKMEIGIIPIQTAGNIEFVELKDAYVVNTPKGIKRCCRTSETTLRLEDGKNRPIDPNNLPQEDAEAILFGSGGSLIRPYAWYHISTNPQQHALMNEFAPKNCDQLTLHILRFALNKLRDIEAMTSKGNRIAAFFRNIWNRIAAIFGNVNRDKIEDIILKMTRDEVLKDSGDGIEYIKRCY